jgi:dsRNA-specific ribonuclease
MYNYMDEIASLAHHDGDIRPGDSTDELVFNPYNPVNKELDMHAVGEILRKYGVTLKPMNAELYKRAFVHKSYVKRPKLENIENGITIVGRPYNCLSLRSRSNERLEFLGDGVLECVTKWYLYRRFPKEDEGFMTEKKIQLVKNEAIGKLAYTLGLHKYYIMSKHAEEKKTRTNLKKLGCLFESFIGALFLDGNKMTCGNLDRCVSGTAPTGIGFQLAQTFIESVLETHIDWVELVLNDDNYKNILQVMIQKEFKVTPTYIQAGCNEETGFRMVVTLYIGDEWTEIRNEDAVPFEHYGGYEPIHNAIASGSRVLVRLGESSHKIKKKAEQEACRLAIQLLGNCGSNGAE